MTRYKIGSSKTVETTQAVLGYLSQVYPRFLFVVEVTSEIWKYEILCTPPDELTLDEACHLTRECRAFICGRGELVS